MEKVDKETPILESPVSTRARLLLIRSAHIFRVNWIAMADSRFVVEDLEKGSLKELKMQRGAGRKTVDEIQDLCTRAGIKMKE